MRDQGTQKEQESKLDLLWLNPQIGQHPFFKVTNSKRIKK